MQVRSLMSRLSKCCDYDETSCMSLSVDPEEFAWLEEDDYNTMNVALVCVAYRITRITYISFQIGLAGVGVQSEACPFLTYTLIWFITVSDKG